jgi:hypothetical protein
MLSVGHLLRLKACRVGRVLGTQADVGAVEMRYSENRQYLSLRCMLYESIPHRFWRLTKTGNKDVEGMLASWKWVSGGSLHHHPQPLRMHLGFRSSDHLITIRRKSEGSVISGRRQYHLRMHPCSRCCKECRISATPNRRACQRDGELSGCLSCSCGGSPTEQVAQLLGHRAVSLAQTSQDISRIGTRSTQRKMYGLPTTLADVRSRLQRFAR